MILVLHTHTCLNRQQGDPDHSLSIYQLEESLSATSKPAEEPIFKICEGRGKQPVDEARWGWGGWEVVLKYPSVFIDKALWAPLQGPALLRLSLPVGCVTRQQYSCVSRRRICSDNCTCCHNEIGVVDQACYLTEIQYTDTRPTSPSTDPVTPGARKAATRVPTLSQWYGSSLVSPRGKRGPNPGPPLWNRTPYRHTAKVVPPENPSPLRSWRQQKQPVNNGRAYGSLKPWSTGRWFL